MKYILTIKNVIAIYMTFIKHVVMLITTSDM